MKRLTQKTAPVGSRILATDSEHRSLVKLFEADVIEWSPKGRVKLRTATGSENWYGDRKIPFLLEVLPDARLS